MGASSWHYVVDYQEDVGAAFEALRLRVFEQGEFLDPTQTLEQILPRIGEIAPKEVAAQYRAKLEHWKANPPQTIDALLERAAESGTHSILDVERIATKSGFGNVRPLRADRIAELTGSAQPTLAQIEQAAYTILEDVDRGEGVVLTAFDAGRPSSLVFLGISGD